MLQKSKKIVILEFIVLNEVVRVLDLMEEFGYARRTATGVLCWLKRQGLVINDRWGEWVLTDRGYDRLAITKGG